ncbi:hypothetical protein CFOL_v3_16848 [Cephalotus follicularis]|uniref:Uncharacterized protein n=1 Tax=Cephalotus follicularis TaxID=3775 RepID=A0A1Q3BZM6_CEPFO|nr:hypothetical protein CFOL_v3_16848 [Cephalotus follicularis]
MAIYIQTDMDAWAKVRKMNRRDGATIRTILLRITGTIITMVILLCSIHSGFKMAAEARKNTNYVSWAFHLGVATMFFGSLLMILGLPILADLFLNLTDQMHEETGIRQAVREKRTTCNVVALFFVTLFTMSMLLWAIYAGFRLATESRSDSKSYPLTTTVGVITIIFGIIYFIIGLALSVELALDLLKRLHQRRKRILVLKATNTDF